MDYRDNFQDMIARYNRELMQTYQKQHPAPPPPQPEPAAVPENSPAPEQPTASSAPPADTRPHYPLFQPAPTMDQCRPAVPPVAAWAPIAAEPATQTAAESAAEATAEQTAEPTDEEPTAPERLSETPESETDPQSPSPSAPPVPTPEITPLPPPEADGAPTEVGYLQVWVTTAQEALPVEGAHVTVSGDDPAGRQVYFIGLTDRSGKTALIPLPAANHQLSMAPGDGTATYTPYNIEVYADGYYRMENIGLPMYGGVKAVQPVQLIPLPEFGNASDTLVFPDSGPSGLSEGEVDGQ